MTLYDRIGKGYDATRRADPWIAARLSELLATEGAEGPLLDVACGTGNYTEAVAARLVPIIGFDLSRRMIASAGRKSSRASWINGDASRMPFADESFTGATMINALHHLRRRAETLAEIYRVLEGGRLVIFTSLPDQMRGYWLNEYFPKTMESSWEQMLEMNEIEAGLEEAGFRPVWSEPYDVREDLEDLFLYSGKHRPERYLDENFRSNISSFSAFADADDVRQGCEKLARDIDSGRISEVIESHRHDRGDYVFVVGEKR